MILIANKLEDYKGYKFKIIDVSIDGTVPSVAGIEKITYKGEEAV
jgi:hypothetical protein